MRLIDIIFIIRVCKWLLVHQEVNYPYYLFRAKYVPYGENNVQGVSVAIRLGLFSFYKTY